MELILLRGNAEVRMARIFAVVGDYRVRAPKKPVMVARKRFQGSTQAVIPASLPIHSKTIRARIRVTPILTPHANIIRRPEEFAIPRS